VAGDGVRLAAVRAAGQVAREPETDGPTQHAEEERCGDTGPDHASSFLGVTLPASVGRQHLDRA
jgi:hypothetical protein